MLVDLREQQGVSPCPLGQALKSTCDGNARFPCQPVDETFDSVFGAGTRQVIAWMPLYNAAAMYYRA